MNGLLRLAIGLAALVGLAPLKAEDAAAIQTANADALAAATMRGEQLYFYDQAGWHVTDAMQQDVKKSDQAALRGYVITADEKGTRATFYGVRDGVPYGIYTAVWERGDGKTRIRQADGKSFGLTVRPVVSGRKMLRSPEEQQLSADQLRLIASRQTVLASLGAENKDFVSRCTNAQMNIAVLPRTGDRDPDLVYITTSQVALDEYPLGGHYRFEVHDGRILGKRAFTKSCINMSTKRDGDKTLEAFVVGHLLDPVPTEIHVFTMLAAQVPIYVGTTQNSVTWSVAAPEGRPVIKAMEKTDSAASKPAN